MFTVQWLKKSISAWFFNVETETQHSKVRRSQLLISRLYNYTRAQSGQLSLEVDWVYSRKYQVSIISLWVTWIIGRSKKNWGIASAVVEKEEEEEEKK